MKSLLVILALAASASADTKVAKIAEFDYGKSYLHAKARKALTTFAKSWQQHRVRVTIEGHGYTEDEEWSIELGQRRADRVRDFLVQHGVDASYLSAVGHSRATSGRYVDLVVAQ
jgi:outer membrane protein OmpA-like peptidoglycan-associated protein